MSLRLAARLVALEPYKVADIQENDTAAHLIDLSAILPKECMAVLIVPIRSSGTGSFIVYPRSHATLNVVIGASTIEMFTIANQEIKWKNSVANDDWDIHLVGYFVQPRTR